MSDTGEAFDNIKPPVCQQTVEGHPGVHWNPMEASISTLNCYDLG